MENQHRKIKGYRELSEYEIEVMNKIKALGPEIENVLELVKCTQDDLDHRAGSTDEEARQWIEAGKMQLKQGLMSLTRAVAKPSFF